MGVKRIGAHENSGNAIIAVIDTGVDYTHPELQGKIWINEDEIPDNGIDDDNNGYIDDIHGWNFSENNNNVMDNHSHGTGIAGIIAAKRNKTAIVGANPNAKIMIIKVLNHKGKGSKQMVYQGLEYAIKNGAHISNISLGWIRLWTPFEKQSKKLLEKHPHHIIIAAAGNLGTEIEYWPSNFGNFFENAFSVGMTTKRDHAHEESNYFDYSIWAPGESIKTTTFHGQYKFWTGTSQAAPLVAAVIGTVKSMYPNLPNSEIKRLVFETATELYSPAIEGRRRELVLKRINAAALFNKLKGSYTQIKNDGNLINQEIYLDIFDQKSLTLTNCTIRTQNPISINARSIDINGSFTTQTGAHIDFRTF